MRIVGIAALLLAAGCLTRPAHRCDASEDCASALCEIPAGETTGLCVHTDADCGSGERYDDDAGGLSGVCVGDEAGTDGGVARFNPCIEQVPPSTLLDACSGAVCAVDERCCDKEWNQVCEHLADDLCDAACGEIGAFVGAGELTVRRWDGDDFVAWWADDIGASVIKAAGWGDYDHDLLPDLATCADGTHGGDAIRIYHNDGDDFALVKAAVTDLDCWDLDWVDVDDDGEVDVIASGGFTSQLVLNAGDDLFADAVPTLIDGNLGQMDWANLDDDARMDVAVTDYEAPLQVFRNTATVTPFYTSDVQRWDSVELGDVDHDGVLNLLASGDGILRVTHNTDRNGFATSPPPLFELTNADYPASALVDLDGDTDLDIVAIAVDGALRAFRNNDVGSGTGFTATPLWMSEDPAFTGATHAVMSLGDADRDGRTDVVVCATPDDCRMWRSLGDGMLMPIWDPGGTRDIRGVALTAAWAGIPAR